MTDASNFQNSSFWDADSVSGVGRWGDPNDDNQITDGGFADDFTVSYPSPHRVRRLFSPAIPERPGVLLTELFTPESQAAMVNDFVGSFIGFHARFETASHGAIHRIVGGCVNFLTRVVVSPV